MCNIGIEGKTFNWNQKITSCPENHNNSCEKNDILSGNPAIKVDNNSKESKTIIKDGLEIRTQNYGSVPVGLNITSPTDPHISGEGSNSSDTQEDENPSAVQPEENSTYEKFIPFIAGEGSSKPH